MKVPASNATQAALDLTGDGAITFDTRQGLPKSITFTGALVVTTGNTTQRIPITVNYELQKAAPAAPAAGPAPGGPAPPAGGGAAAPKAGRPRRAAALHRRGAAHQVRRKSPSRCRPRPGWSPSAPMAAC